MYKNEIYEMDETELKAIAAKHSLVVEYYDCETNVLNDGIRVEEYIVVAAHAAKATLIKSIFHPFFPQGVSGVVVIAESHLTIHTWPEHGYAAVDIFTCGCEASPERACDYLTKKLRARRSTTVEIKRGQFLQHHDDEVVIPLEAGIRKRSLER